MALSSMVLMKYHGVPIHERGLGFKVNLNLILRAVFGTAAHALFFVSLHYMTLADASVIFFSQPITTLIFAALILGEPFRRVDLFIVILCIGGVICIAQPPTLFGEDAVAPPFKGILIGAIAAMSASSSFVCMR